MPARPSAHWSSKTVPPRQPECVSLHEEVASSGGQPTAASKHRRTSATSGEARKNPGLSGRLVRVKPESAHATPTGHVEQLVPSRVPLCMRYAPASQIQSASEAALSPLVVNPTGHLSIRSEASAQKEPTEQGRQSAIVLIWTLGLYVPAGHGCCVSLVLPCGQKWPGSHGPVQKALVCCGKSPTWPGSHGEGRALPATQ
jgi:hypothetical protein